LLLVVVCFVVMVENDYDRCKCVVIFGNCCRR
jgi:hypothetical protein